MHAWLEARQRAGERTFFFVTERGRVRALKRSSAKCGRSTR